MTDQSSPFTDPTMRRLVEISSQEFTARSGDGHARAVVRGDLAVSSVSVDSDVQIGMAGQEITDALNRALSSARSEIRTEMAAIPGLRPELRGLLTDEGPDVEPTESLGREDVMREFSSEVDSVIVKFSAPEQEFTSVYLPSFEHIGSVAKAANRAMASAATGRDGAIGIDEVIDDRLAELDEAMSAIESRLDGVESSLDAMLADLD